MASPMQFCMETSDWLKAIISDEGATDVNLFSSPSGELMPCPLLRPSAPMLERRLRPPHDQALKCPRCDSAHTKFCYYNNYSLSQPRYFCKTCRRYWTKGGSLRNVPIGGGCRKNKRPASSKNKHPSAADQIQSMIHQQHHHHHHQQTDLHLSSLNFMLGIPGGGHFAAGLDLGDHNAGGAPLGYSIDEACQRLAVPFGEAAAAADVAADDDVKPGNRMLSLEWPDHQGCGAGGSFGYSNGSSLGLWAGMINGHGP